MVSVRIGYTPTDLHGFEEQAPRLTVEDMPNMGDRLILRRDLDAPVDQHHAMAAEHMGRVIGHVLAEDSRDIHLLVEGVNNIGGIEVYVIFEYSHRSNIRGQHGNRYPHLCLAVRVEYWGEAAHSNDLRASLVELADDLNAHIVFDA